MERKVKYPIGIQSFSEIIEGGYKYVDKTRQIYDLCDSGKYYFLARPRRFGKSLLLSTIKAYYEGRKDLFEGLAIEKLENDWVKHPVILLSLAAYDAKGNSLYDLLDNRFNELEKEYDVDTIASSPSERFRNIIRSARQKTGRNVVILVDEYDAPMVAHLEDDKNREEMRNILKSVYTNLKDMDEYIKFGMLTGVSRFSKLTVFSGLNNLSDISLDVRYSDICGITEDELETYFHEGIEDLAEELDVDFSSAIAELKANYDGYHFTKSSEDIYNPFSLLQALSTSELNAYWFQSGTPTFLVKVLRRRTAPLYKLFTERVSEMLISDIDTYRSSPLALLFQTGYLTIKDYDAKRRRYTLGIPNKEVEVGLFTALLSDNMDMEKYKVDQWAFDIRENFEEGRPAEALRLAKEFLASIPATVTQKSKELYFEDNLYMLLKMVGCNVQAEYWTSSGRIDLLLTTDEYIYVMELKLDSTPEAALEQIEHKEYSLQWESDGRKVLEIGINCLSSTRNLDSWIIR